MTKSWRRPLAPVALATLFLLAPAAAKALTVEEIIDRTFELAPGGSVSVENTNGDLDVVSWDRSEVRIVATKSAKAASESAARHTLEDLEVDIDASPGAIIVRTHRPRSDWGLLNWLSGRATSSEVSYRLTVPRDAEVELRTVNGKVEIESVAGPITARSVNGRIRVLDAQSSATISTTNGSIDAEFTALHDHADLELSTTNGRVTVLVPEDLSAEVSARTVNGSVSTDLPLESVQRRGWRRQSLSGVLGAGGGSLRVRTVNGSIRLKES